MECENKAYARDGKMESPGGVATVPAGRVGVIHCRDGRPSTPRSQGKRSGPRPLASQAGSLLWALARPAEHSAMTPA
jgi:hypothetical protein